MAAKGGFYLGPRLRLGELEAGLELLGLFERDEDGLLTSGADERDGGLLTAGADEREGGLLTAGADEREGAEDSLLLRERLLL